MNREWLIADVTAVGSLMEQKVSRVFGSFFKSVWANAGGHFCGQGSHVVIRM